MNGTCFVRVSTSTWWDGRALHAEKRFSVLRRRSTNPDLIKEECDMAGSDDALNAITKTLDVSDGLYELKAFYYRDCESGMVECIDYELIKLVEERMGSE